MPKKSKYTTDPEVLDAFRRMIAGVDGVELRGAACPYTSLHGNMYTSISRQNCIGIRLDKADREEFMQKYNTGLFEAFPGFYMKEYVAVPESLLSDTRVLRRYFRRSYDYAASLKPHPRKKPK